MSIEEFVVEVDDELYNQAAKVCEQYGITVEDAVELFIKEFALSKQIPVDQNSISDEK